MIIPARLPSTISMLSKITGIKVWFSEIACERGLLEMLRRVLNSL